VFKLHDLTSQTHRTSYLFIQETPLNND